MWEFAGNSTSQETQCLAEPIGGVPPIEDHIAPPINISRPTSPPQGVSAPPLRLEDLPFGPFVSYIAHAISGRTGIDLELLVVLCVGFFVAYWTFRRFKSYLKRVFILDLTIEQGYPHYRKAKAFAVQYIGKSSHTFFLAPMPFQDLSEYDAADVESARRGETSVD